MKILLVHERFAPDFAGGGEWLVLKSATRLAARGIDVRVLTTGDPALGTFEGLPTRRLPIHRYLLNFAAGAVEAAARDVDVIQTFTYHGCLPSLRAGRRLGKPVVCMALACFGDAWLEMRGALAGRVWRGIERFLMRRPYDRLVFMSEYSKGIGLIAGANASRTAVIPPGIEAALYTPTRPKDNVVLFVGKLDVRKGIWDVLAAAAALPEIRFRIVGFGSEARAVYRAAPPNVEMVPWPLEEPLRAEFRRARVFLLPSRAEGFSIALLESMAAGCAVVSTLPLPFVGERVAIGDVAGITAAVRRFWSDPELAAAVGQENLRRAGELNWDRHVDALLTVYEDVLRARGRAGREAAAVAG